MTKARLLLESASRQEGAPVQIAGWSVVERNSQADIFSLANAVLLAQAPRPV